MKILIIKPTEWGAMPVLHSIPPQLRILAAKHPVAQEWIRLIDESKIDELPIDDANYPDVIKALQNVGLINAARAAQLLLR